MPISCDLIVDLQNDSTEAVSGTNNVPHLKSMPSDRQADSGDYLTFR